MVMKKELSPDKFACIENLALIAQSVVSGHYAGMHGSRKFGQSDNFVDIRKYEPGDPLRLIDWRAYARTDKLHVRKFHDDSNMHVFILLDSSASMAFASGAVDKFTYGACLSACFSLLALNQRDSVGFAAFNESLRGVAAQKSDKGQFYRIIDIIQTLNPEGRSLSRDLAGGVADLIRQKNLIIVISDLLEECGGLITAIAELRGMGHDIIVLHVLDPQELSFSYDGMLKLVDPETGRKVTMDARDLHDSYHDVMRDFLANTEKEIIDMGARYFLISTANLFDDAMRRVLTSGRQ